LSKARETAPKAGRIEVRRATIADAAAVARLIEPGFVRHIAPTLSIVGRVAFRMYVTEKALRARLGAGAVAWCAVAAASAGHSDSDDQGAIVGYAELRGSDGAAGGIDHLSLLFSAVTRHRQGIARQLLDTIVRHRRSTTPGAGRLTVNASAFALPIYERLGFVRSAADTEEGGIVATPMCLELDPAAMASAASRAAARRTD
jgi:GNAT superfamily N-acetyltransferase